MASLVRSPFAFFFFIIFLFSVFISTTNSHKERQTHLHFFMHDTVSGPNATAIKIIPSSGNAADIKFGHMTMIDDLLTEGPNLRTKIVGRAQGFYAVASLSEPALLLTMNLVFTEGKHNGSTLAVVSRDAILSPVRELPVVGGTGRFRLARGYALMKTYWYNVTSGDAILELDVYVLHH